MPCRNLFHNQIKEVGNPWNPRISVDNILNKFLSFEKSGIGDFYFVIFSIFSSESVAVSNRSTKETPKHEHIIDIFKWLLIAVFATPSILDVNCRIPYMLEVSILYFILIT